MLLIGKAMQPTRAMIMSMHQRLAGFVDSGQLVRIRLEESMASADVVGIVHQVGSLWTLVQVTDATFHWGGFQFARTKQVVDAQELPAETAEYMTRGLRTRRSANVPYFTGLGRTDEVVRAATQAPDRPVYRLDEASQLIRLHMRSAAGDPVHIGRVTSIDEESCEIREITPFGAWQEAHSLLNDAITRIETGSRHLKGLLKFGDPYADISDTSAEDR